VKWSEVKKYWSYLYVFGFSDYMLFLMILWIFCIFLYFTGFELVGERKVKCCQILLHCVTIGKIMTICKAICRTSKIKTWKKFRSSYLHNHSVIFSCERYCFCCKHSYFLYDISCIKINNDTQKIKLWLNSSTFFQI
jgi:hypothetical protein